MASEGHVIWPTRVDGVIAITTAQLGYMLEGIDWRNPQRSWRPEQAGECRCADGSACMTTARYDSLSLVTSTDALPDDIDALKAALLAERSARMESEARAAGAEAMVAHLKLLIAKMKHDRFGASSERGRKLLDQVEMQLENLETSAGEVEAAAKHGPAAPLRPTARGKPVRRPLPAHLPRERVVLPSPSACPCCGGRLSKLGESVTETLEIVPRRWKVIQTVREKWSCRSCEAITQLPAPLHPIVRGRAGTSGDGSRSQVRPAPAAQSPK